MSSFLPIGDTAARASVLGVILLGALVIGSVDSSWWRPWGAVDPGWLGPRLAVIVLIGYAAIAAGLALSRRWIDAASLRWWEPSGSADGDLEWDRLLELIDRRHDPLRRLPRTRVVPAIAGLLVLLPAAMAIGGVAEALAGFVWHPALPERLLRPSGERIAPDALANLSGDLTALLALVAALVSIWFTSSQLRAKVLADNRQEWLGRTRTLMGRVVSLAAERADAAPGERGRLLSRLDPLRLELELRLNPSERDHRLLMYLLRRLTFAGEIGRADRADEGVLVDEIRLACDRMAAEDPVRFGTDPYGSHWRPLLETEDAATLVTHCMRLSHVVLKREWERVKATR